MIVKEKSIISIYSDRIPCATIRFELSRLLTQRFGKAHLNLSQVCMFSNPFCLSKIYLYMTNTSVAQSVVHPMGKLQRKVQSLVNSRKLKPHDSLWKVGLLFPDKWSHLKHELLDFEFSMQDPIQSFLEVEGWDDE